MDKSLLDRLAALRGSSPTTSKEPPVKFEVDVIERKNTTPSREGALATRLKALREQASPSPSSSPVSSPSKHPRTQDVIPAPEKPTQLKKGGPAEDRTSPHPDDEVEAAFATDDQTLEELLGDIGHDETFAAHVEPDDDKVKALLEELSQSIPQDEGPASKGDRQGREEDSDDDSDGEKMTREVDDVIARFRDELEVEAALASKDDDAGGQDSSDEGGAREPAATTAAAADLELPSVPQDLTAAAFDQVPGSSPASTSIDDITARLSALRASSASPSLSLPSVPTSKPAKEPKRLTSRTNYTDDDVDSWCTVCLDDATLKCLGCDDGDPYCARCWREMHVGPAAAFDDRDHKAVYFKKEGKKKKEKEKRVAIGA